MPTLLPRRAGTGLLFSDVVFVSVAIRLFGAEHWGPVTGLLFPSEGEFNRSLRWGGVISASVT